MKLLRTSNCFLLFQKKYRSHSMVYMWNKTTSWDAILSFTWTCSTHNQNIWKTTCNDAASAAEQTKRSTANQLQHTCLHKTIKESLCSVCTNLSSLYSTLQSIENNTLHIHASNKDAIKDITNLPETFILSYKQKCCTLIDLSKKTVSTKKYLTTYPHSYHLIFLWPLVFLPQKAKLFLTTATICCFFAYILQSFSSTQKQCSLADIAQLYKKWIPRIASARVY